MLRPCSLALLSLLGPGQVDGIEAPGEGLPRLVVMVSIDQLREGQLDRLEADLHGGLGRMLREGRRFEGALLPYAASETGPGHVTLGTGCLPVRHGVIGNEWVRRADGAKVYCVGGPATLLASTGAIPGAGRDATNLEVPTLGDRMRARWPEARVVAVSGKDRGAIGMAGAAAAPALWWDRGGRGWLSSTAFGEVLPAWAVQETIEWPTVAAGWTWEPSFEEAPPGTAPDRRVGEGALPGGDGTLPWTLPGGGEELDEGGRARLAAQVYGTPMVDLLTMRLASRAVREGGLGADEVPDLLTISLSACDSVGHRSGPLSVEATDTILRADDLLGTFFADLDSRLGEGSWIACLSADHGVVDLPEHEGPQGAYGRRLVAEDLRPLASRLREETRRLLGDTCGVELKFREVRMDEAAVRAAGGDPARLRQRLREVVLEQASWVEDVFVFEELIGEGASGALGRFQRSSRPESAPDLALHPRPGVYVGYATGTSHGTAHDYDRSIPLLFLGAGVEAGAESIPAGSQDAVPSLMLALGWSAEDLRALGLDGRPLALRQEGR